MDIAACDAAENVKDCYFFMMSFHYFPSASAAFAIAGIFALVTAASIVQMTRYNKAAYMWTVAAMGLCETTGYAIRGVVARSPSVPLYVNSQLLLLLAPIALACVNYIVVGRLTKASGHRVGCLQPHHIARMFLTTDLLTFAIQSAGGAIQATSGTDAGRSLVGQYIILAGLVIQILFFLSFTYLATYVGSRPEFGMAALPQKSQVFTCLYATIGLMLVRNLYRVIDKSVPTNNGFTTSEWVFFVGETVPMFAAFVVYLWYHFGRLLPDEPNADWKARLATANPLAHAGGDAAESMTLAGHAGHGTPPTVRVSEAAGGRVVA